MEDYITRFDVSRQQEGCIFRYNLGTYYFGTPANEHDWTTPHNDNLWQDDVKTLLDPCPAGWRVPRSGVGSASPWNAFGTDPYSAPFYYYINGVRQTAPGVPVFALSPNNGRRYDRGGGATTAWYSTPGSRGYGEGAMWSIGNFGFSWSSTVSGISGMYLGFNYAWLYPSSTTNRADGFSVRCVRE